MFSALTGALLAVILLLAGAPLTPSTMPAGSQQDGAAAEPPAAASHLLQEPSFYVYEVFSARADMSYELGYNETATMHYLFIVGESIPFGTHNVTLLLYDATPIATCLYTDPANSTQWVNSTEPQQIIITTSTGSFRSQLLFAAPTGPGFDPLDIFFDPFDVEAFSVSTEGDVRFGIELYASSFVPEVRIELASTDGRFVTKTVSADVPVESFPYGFGFRVDLSNVTKGSHEVRVEAALCAPVGTRLSGLARISLRNESFTAYRVFLDSAPVSHLSFLQAQYQLRSVSTLLAVEPWVIGTRGRTTIVYNFSVNPNFSLYLADDYREHIQFFTASQPAQGILVRKDLASNRYILDINFGGPTQVTLGLAVADLTWFLRPSVLENLQVPEAVWNEVFATFDYLMDYTSDYVQLWAGQIRGNLRNPLLVAQALQNNLTRTMNYTESYFGRPLLLSQILQNRRGVCEHISRAFSGLCVAAGVPSRLVQGWAAGDFAGKHALWAHQWSEVYLGPYGWVTVDTTWHEFNSFSPMHLVHTWWSYVPRTLSSSAEPSSQALYSLQNATERWLDHLCAGWRQTIGVPVNWIPGHIAQSVDRWLSDAEYLVGMGQVHDAMVLLCEAFLQAEASVLPSFATSVLIVAIPIVVVSVYDLWYKRHSRRQRLRNRRLLARWKRARGASSRGS